MATRIKLPEAKIFTELRAEGAHQQALSETRKMLEHRIAWAIITDVTGIRPEDLQNQEFADHRAAKRPRVGEPGLSEVAGAVGKGGVVPSPSPSPLNGERVSVFRAIDHTSG